jgi:hypothetical protein
MSRFSDFVFNRNPSAPWTLAMAMIAARMGERQLLVGDDAALFTLVAGKAGLTGRIVVVVGSEEAAARIEAAAAEAGVLIEDVRRAALPELPVENQAFDVAVVNAGPAFLTLSPADRTTLATGIHRALRVGGRLIVVEGQPPRLFGLIRAQPEGLAAFRADGGAGRLLESAGFRPVRLLADRAGQRFTEGIKGN